MSGDRPTHVTRRRVGLTAGQWTILVVLGGMFLAVIGALLWVLREGLLGEPVDVLATVIAGPPPTLTPSQWVVDAVPVPGVLYQPAVPQPLATPNAPGDLLWWDARYAYRLPILFDPVSAQQPAGTWAQVLFDGERAQEAGKMRADGADLRVVVWDGTHWWEIPRHAEPRSEKRGWSVILPLQAVEVARQGAYYLYYGNPAAGPPPAADQAPTSSRLLLAQGEEEGVEWGPAVTWTANSPTPQTLVSPDGRMTITCPPGGPQITTRVRLRTVPLSEKNTNAVLPVFELHAEPPPGPPGASQVIHWDPELVVTINWAGLPVTVADIEQWTVFAYNEETASWYSVPIEFDRQRGLTRMVTDQL